ncbi:MAG TPA: PhoH family protein, partial [Spirochaetia bacterium]|nr:PhoH family protein [Spirochaetia bacterium]
MAEKRAIVLKDDLLCELCGANDQNLKAFEELLGVSIFYRGNEITLDSEDESIQQRFKLLLAH